MLASSSKNHTEERKQDCIVVFSGHGLWLLLDDVIDDYIINRISILITPWSYVYRGHALLQKKAYFHVIAVGHKEDFVHDFHITSSSSSSSFTGQSIPIIQAKGGEEEVEEWYGAGDGQLI